MSTSERFLSDEDIADFIRETRADPTLYTIGEEGSDIGIAPFLTFYIYHDRQSEEQFLEIAYKVIDVYEQFEAVVDEPFALKRKDDTQDWLKADDKRLPTDLRARARGALAEDQVMFVWATDMDSPMASARWAFGARVTDNPSMGYTTVKITFRYRWYRDHREQWLALVHKWVALLQPEQCYSGFEVGNADFAIMGSYESDVLERICADYFYGMDIDRPSAMGFVYHDRPDGWSNPIRLGTGLRTPTWCFMLSPYWLGRLGLSESRVRAELDDPRIEITAIPYAVTKHNPQGDNGLWIRLGELSLHPVENGLPELLVKANRLIRPVRCNDLALLSLDPWDDDPNPRFDFDSGPQWMARFDDDSTWPTPEKRAGPPADAAVFAMTGEPCPRAGLWSPRADVPLPDVHMSKGTPMPLAEWHDTQGLFQQRAIRWQLVKAMD